MNANTTRRQALRKADGAYSSAANSIPVLQRRGAVFLACHNQVWEIAAKRVQAGVNPDRLSHEAMAAELSNHLIAGVVLTPGAPSGPCRSFCSRGSPMPSSAARFARAGARAFGLARRCGSLPTSLVVALGLAIAFATATAPAAAAQPAPVPGPSPATSEIYPPWQHGANNPALNKGLEFTVPEADNLADFHGNLNDPRLVLYYGGNSFFAMAPLVQAFETKFPRYKGRIYFETLPPGLLAKQMANGGTITVGNMTWTVKPDAYFAGLNQVKSLIDSKALVGPPVAYVTNDLAIMVAAGNPLHIAGLADLAKPDVRLAMPNPAFEGVARQIQASLVKAGGEALKASVYEQKVKDGTAVLTQIHHRQTPLLIMQGKVDAGVTWQSEVAFQVQAGHPITDVAIPAAQNTTAVYAGAAVRGAAHPQAARDWLYFIRSPAAMEIFSRYGFKPYTGRGTLP